MAIILVEDKLTKEDFQKAREDYESYIKLTIDIEQEKAALGGEYHADAEKLLLNQGSKQENIWGGGVNLETKQFETNAIINLRPGKNDSPEILDPQTRNDFLKIAKKVLKNYVR
ncbi:hypothetical protein A2Z41_01860 [Microgenomates group bacterium RBG_19FT_COMBO_39_10]|nr:MAG: hypothetical protein A2Z41_01860 [Microgenomates group bacterium RBG_19FT_COMBO_39_10]